MDPIGIKAAVAALPSEAQPLLNFLMSRLDTLEAQTAKDTNDVADKVIAALVPQLQAMTQTVNAVADQSMTILRRVDGLKLTVALGPES